MKRFLVMLTAVCMSCCSALTSFAATAETTTPIACPAGFTGGTLSVRISADIEDLSGIHLTFKYDRSKLRYTDQKTAIGHGDAVEDSETLEWSSMLSPDGQKVTYSDNIATLNFDVISELSDNEKYIEVGIAEAYDSNMKDVDFTKTGLINITFTGDIGIAGDLDKDGVVTSNDALTILRTSIGDTASLDSTEKKLYDCNNDSSIDSTDALEALRFSVDLPTSSNTIGKPLTITNEKADYLRNH